MRDLLQEESCAAENLRRRLPDLRNLGVILNLNTAEPASETDIEHWEDRVRSLLRSHPWKEAGFDSEMPARSSPRSPPFYDPLTARLEHRMHELEHIIQEVDNRMALPTVQPRRMTGRTRAGFGRLPPGIVAQPSLRLATS